MEKPEVPLSLPCTKGHPQALETFIQRARLSGWLQRASRALEGLGGDPMRGKPPQPAAAAAL